VPGASVADNELHLSRRLDIEGGPQPDFEIAHGHDAVDGSLAKFLGESEDVRGDRAQVAVLLFQAVQLPRLRSGRRALAPPALDLLRVDIDEGELLAMHAPRCDRLSRRRGHVAWPVLWSGCADGRECP
jgi:hypothetical protein